MLPVLPEKAADQGVTQVVHPGMAVVPTIVRHATENAPPAERPFDTVPWLQNLRVLVVPVLGRVVPVQR